MNGKRKALIEKRKEDDRESLTWTWTIRNYFILSRSACVKANTKMAFPRDLSSYNSHYLGWCFLILGGYLENYLINTIWPSIMNTEASISSANILSSVSHPIHSNFSLSIGWVKDNLHITKINDHFLPLTKLALKHILHYWSQLLRNSLFPSCTT